MSWVRFWKTLKEIAKWVPVIVVAAKKAYDWFKELKPHVRDWWQGKKIAIIGPTAVGKNSLYNRLQDKPIPSEHINTKAMEDIPKFKLRRHLPDGKEFEITVKRSTNVGGEKEQRDRFWFDACKSSDVIFYMLSLDDLRKGRYKPGGRVHEDLEWLAQHLGEMSSSPKIHFLVNKIDLELKQMADYDEFVEQLKPKVIEFDEITHRILGRYKARITGISATSMLDDGIFNRSLVLVLESVYDAVHRKKPAKTRVGASAS
jgi:hypothetical protein